MRKLLLIVAIIAAIAAVPILRAQFHGEDEVSVYVTAVWLADAFKVGDVVTLVRVLVGSYHPPGRYLLATVSFLILKPSPVALRLPALLLWVMTGLLAADIARRLASRWAGLITGVLLGGSGLFSLEALGFGHGAATFWVMLFIWLKVKHPIWGLNSKFARHQYLIGGAMLAMGFLWFTSLLPIAGMYHLYYAYTMRHYKNRRYWRLTLPFILFYGVYYLIFLGVPYYAWTHGLRDRPVGQLHQNLARRGSTRLNVESFRENLKGLNWYHLPFISWALLVVGVVWQWYRTRPLFFILTPYALLFSFYIVDNTLQHFLSYYIWLLPFAVAGLWQWGVRHGRDWHGAIFSLLVAACVGAAVFGYAAHMQSYTEVNYPYRLEQAIFGSSKWRTNLVRPLPEIAHDVPSLLGPKDRWTVTIDGALPMYYFPDDRYVTIKIEEEKTCWQLKVPPTAKLRVIVRSQAQPPLCDIVPTRTVHYPGSLLEVVVVD